MPLRTPIAVDAHAIPGSGTVGCSRRAHIHQCGKMESMGPLEMVMTLWQKAYFEAYSELMVEKTKEVSGKCPCYGQGC
jgi:hypothetical protein